MSAPVLAAVAAPAIAAPLADFFSWGLDSMGKLLRGEIDGEAMWQEVLTRQAECAAEVEKLRQQTLSDRAALDADAAKKFAAVGAPAGTTPPIIEPRATGES